MPPQTRAYRFAHVLIGGFTQRVGTSGNGIYTLFDRLYREWAAPDSLVEYFPWFVGPAHLAAALAHRNTDCVAEHGQALKIQLVGYSFGGQTIANVCRLLHGAGVNVHRVCLSDAVARCGRLGWLRAINPWGRIVIPPNVAVVEFYRQTHSRWQFQAPFFHPAGHPIVTEKPTEARGVIARGLQHTDMDNDRDFHFVAALQAQELHAGITRTNPTLPFPRASA